MQESVAALPSLPTTIPRAGWPLTHRRFECCQELVPCRRKTVCAPAHTARKRLSIPQTRFRPDDVQRQRSTASPRPSQPSPRKTCAPQAADDVRAISRELPQQAATIIFDHQDDRPLIEPVMPQRDPPAIKIAGISRVQWVERRFEAIGVEPGQLSLMNAILERGQHDFWREGQRRHDGPRRECDLVGTVAGVAGLPARGLSFTGGSLLLLTVDRLWSALHTSRQCSTWDPAAGAVTSAWRATDRICRSPFSAPR